MGLLVFGIQYLWNCEVDSRGSGVLECRERMVVDLTKVNGG